MNYFALPGVKHEELKSRRAGTIIETVCDHFGIPFDEVNIKTRKREVLIVRQTIMYLLCKYTRLSLKEIGRLFKAQYDHTTVIHSRDLIDDLLSYDSEVFYDVNSILIKIGEPAIRSLR